MIIDLIYYKSQLFYSIYFYYNDYLLLFLPFSIVILYYSIIIYYLSYQLSLLINYLLYYLPLFITYFHYLSFFIIYLFYCFLFFTSIIYFVYFNSVSAFIIRCLYVSNNLYNYSLLSHYLDNSIVTFNNYCLILLNYSLLIKTTCLHLFYN